MAAVLTLSLALAGYGLLEGWLGQRGPVQTLAKRYEMPAGSPPVANEEVAVVTLELALDRDTAALLWDEHVPDDLPRRRGKPFDEGIYGNLDGVDFDSQVVALWWGGEATCAQAVTDVQLPEPATVELHTTEEAPDCLDMAIPFRMLLAIDRDRLPDPAELPANLAIVRDGHRRNAGQADLSTEAG
ncbi:hypothetical protein [Egicoccus halophilus]|uniref:hypothetical protein n=1 Tax=Egicoccus halophilus TaxID=1670830 RepID=UPI001030CF57|nr:hypothetical protein [Egicoccus halophilus]